MNLLDRLPWRRRTRAIERHTHDARKTLVRVHNDWTPLARDLARIDREIELNDWTATAKRIFAGEG